MTIITDQGFEISDNNNGKDNDSNGNGANGNGANGNGGSVNGGSTNGNGSNRQMSRKAKKRAAARARREAAAAETTDAGGVEDAVDETKDADDETKDAVVETDDSVDVEETTVEAEPKAVAVDDKLAGEETADEETVDASADAVTAETDTAEADDAEPHAAEDGELDATAEDEATEVADTEVEETEIEAVDVDVMDEEVVDEEAVDETVETLPEIETELEVEAEPEVDLADVDTAVVDATDVGTATEVVLDGANETAQTATVEAESIAQTEAQNIGDTGVWTGRQLTAVAQQVLAVFVVLGLIGYGVGFGRGGGNTARAEFVYTLDESVPDSFLREDRRLLTQVVTFKSDAVLTPVAAEFDLTVDELRAKIDVDTLNLSEVLRLDVSDDDASRAVALNQAVLDQYLRVIADATPAGDGEELADRRADISAELEVADAARLDLLKTQEQDVTLQLQQESLQQRISIKNTQVGVLQQDLDQAIIQQTGTTQRATVANTLAAAEADLADLEAQLLEVGTQRAALATATTAEPALLREIERLEAKLTTIDNELAERELAPLVASPIRELSEPIVLSTSRHLGGLQGMALGLFLAMPIAALVALRARKRQLWFD